MRLTSYLIFVFAVYLALPAVGQHIGFDHITIDDGLMHNNVNSIVQDSEGFMWFGTRDGLCRYDGYDFRVYPITDSSGAPISDQRIQKLFLDHKGNIWVMPTIGGLHLFNTHEQKFQKQGPHKVNQTLNKIIIQSVLGDSNGNYWIGTTENGVLCIDSLYRTISTFTTASTEPNRQITGEHCYSIAEDQFGRIWFGLSGLFVNRYDPTMDSLVIVGESAEGYEGLYSYRRSFARIGDTMWVGTEGQGVLAYSIPDERYVNLLLPKVYVRDLECSPDGRLLVSGFQYTSSRIITRDNFDFKYGRVDIRAALPFGQGIWPALWMLGSNFGSVGWPACGEIDIMEMIGGNGREKTVHGTAHWEQGGHASYGDSYTLTSGDFQNEFHVFSIEWDETSIKWYVDDQLYNTLDTSPSALSEFRGEHFFIMNVAVGGNWPGYPDGTTVFPQRMIVDYIRVFQPE